MKPKSSKTSKRKPAGRTRALAVDAGSASDFLAWLNSPASREKHRNKYNDMEWAGRQPKGAPKYRVGDVVEFHVGGFGVIDKVSEPQGGWPSSYATDDIAGMAPHKTRKSAWHYEGDFKRWVAKSPLHSLQNSD
jgi:hypothetical protein